MRVVVDEARKHQATLELHDARAPLAYELAHLVAAPDLQDAVAAHGDGLGPGLGRLEGVDPGSEQHEVRDVRGGLSAAGKGGEGEARGEGGSGDHRPERISPSLPELLQIDHLSATWPWGGGRLNLSYRRPRTE